MAQHKHRINLKTNLRPLYLNSAKRKIKRNGGAKEKESDIRAYILPQLLLQSKSSTEYKEKKRSHLVFDLIQIL